MGFFKRLLGPSTPNPPPPPRLDTQGRPSWMRPGVSLQVTLYEGTEDLGVVGESNYQDVLWGLVGSPRGTRVHHDIHAILVPEDDNPYDGDAISIWISGLKVGYLSREDARRYRPGLVALMRKAGQPIALAGVVAGGGMDTDGPRMLGVFLSHDPVDFGLPGRTRSERTLRTGLSMAVATDEADDSYDLSWADGLPDDPVRRIPRLRALLANDPDAIDRHYIFNMLEADLYACRDAFPSALTDYDETSERHHAEIVGSIRAALLVKFGAVPLLETYRQAAIRHQKAHDWPTALLWAERGIEVYGAEAARPDAVDDLTQRAQHCRAKLAGTSTRPRIPRAPQPRQPTIEELLCSSCGRTWQRPVVRGRKPTRCPDCAPADPVASSDL